MPKSFSLATVALLALAGCDAVSPGGSVGFAQLDLPAQPVLINGTTVIRDQTTLESFARGWDGNVVPLPTVDFERQMVVGVFYGGSFHGGCSSQVDVVETVRHDGDALVVSVGALPDLGICQAVVYPADMVVVDAVSPKVRFVGKLPR
jgi:hypothetical protein